MSETRAERSTFVFRILYLGSTGARKFDAVKKLHAALPPVETEPLAMLVAGSETIVSFRYRPHDVKILGIHDVAYDVHVCPGRFRTGAAHRLLLRSADAVVFLVDGESKDPHRDFDEVVACLGNLGKRPEDLPLVIAMAEGVSADAWAREARAEWHPLLHKFGESPDDVVDVFLSCGKAVCEHAEMRLEKLSPDDGDDVDILGSADHDREVPVLSALASGGGAEFLRPLTNGSAQRLQSLDVEDTSRGGGRRRSLVMLVVGVILLFAALSWWIARRL